MKIRLRVLSGAGAVALALSLVGVSSAQAADPWLASGLQGQQKCGNGGGSTLTISIPYNNGWTSFSYTSSGYYGPYYFAAPASVKSGSYSLSCWNGGGKSGTVSFSGGVMNNRNFCANLPWWQWC